MQPPVCPGCGEPIGVYEAVWRFAADVGAELTSWLRLEPDVGRVQSLWHVRCAEADGVDGG